jgi:hypothetical protein
MGFPAAGADVPVLLEVSVKGDREVWCRRFAGRPVVSRQWERDHLLIEAFGVNSFSCNLAIAGPDLIYEFRRAWLAGIALPSWIAPRVDGRVTGDPGGWHVSVRVFAPVLGEILHYEGRVEPE